MTDDQTIPLLSSPGSGLVRGHDDDLRGSGASDVVRRVSITHLQEQIEKLSQIVQGDALSQVRPGRFQVEEIKVVAEISASGELGFLVGGVEAEAKGSIELVFRRSGASAGA